mmetsp:Transcript_3826/g.8915  ORF Transcript_3826/g.8915 Transcript_3826/m.8915 type:complete len:259 (-) Transcript_3826:32-808(-)
MTNSKAKATKMMVRTTSRSTLVDLSASTQMSGRNNANSRAMNINAKKTRLRLMARQVGTIAALKFSIRNPCERFELATLRRGATLVRRRPAKAWLPDASDCECMPPAGDCRPSTSAGMGKGARTDIRRCFSIFSAAPPASSWISTTREFRRCPCPVPPERLFLRASLNALSEGGGLPFETLDRLTVSTTCATESATRMESAIWALPPASGLRQPANSGLRSDLSSAKDFDTSSPSACAESSDDEAESPLPPLISGLTG